MSLQFELPKRSHPDFAIPGKKPLGGVEIDWSNPLSKKLEYCFLGTQGARNLVNGVPDVLTGNTVLRRDHLYFDGNVSSTVEIQTPFDKIGDSVFSTFIIADNDSTAANPILIARGDTSANEWMLRLTHVNTSVSRLSFYANTGQTNNAPADLLDRVGGSYGFSYGDSTEKNVVYHKGDKLTTDSSGTLVDVSGVSKPLTLGGADAHTGRVLKGSIYYVLGFSRYLTDREHKSLQQDPYQILKPATPMHYFTPTAGAPPSLFQAAWAANCNLLIQPVK